MTCVRQEYELFSLLVALERNARDQMLGYVAVVDAAMAARLRRLLAYDERLGRLSGDWPFAPATRAAYRTT